MKITDNKDYSKNDFSEIENITKKILDKTLDYLQEDLFIFPEMLKNSEDISGKQKILETKNDYIRTGNIMGFIGYGDERLTIGSRFSDGKNDYFFQYLLEKVLDLPNVLNFNHDYDSENNSINLLMFLFPYYLKSAMRKGLFKTYITNRYNDMNLKGIIDIPRHIGRNTPFIGNIAYNRREFSYDNYVTQLIRHTIEFIRQKKYGNTLLQRSKDEVSAIVRESGNYRLFDRRKVIIDNRKKPLRQAYYHEYRQLQRLCLAILNHEKHQIGNGNREQGGIIFDGTWLWEEYVNLLLKDKFYHPRNKTGEGKQHLFYKMKGLIYPDFISRNSPRIIADAKYKPIDNIYGRDYLQLLAYMYRFDAKTGFFIYPESENQDEQKLYLNQGTTYDNVIKREDIFVTKLGIKIPKDINNYNEFREEMKNNEDWFQAEM
jgi:5-methylcytosine-specific restriction endonuclease McrBC regulatory subunit McrC